MHNDSREKSLKHVHFLNISRYIYLAELTKEMVGKKNGEKIIKLDKITIKRFDFGLITKQFSIILGITDIFCQYWKVVL